MIICVVGIIINMKGEILLEKHNKVNAYTLPGGKLDDGENPKKGIIRELEEEIGINAVCSREPVLTKIHKSEYPTGSGNITEFMEYYYTVLFYEGHIINKEPEKHEELIWMKPEEIRSSGIKISAVLESYLESIGI